MNAIFQSMGVLGGYEERVIRVEPVAPLDAMPVLYSPARKYLSYDVAVEKDPDKPAGITGIRVVNKSDRSTTYVLLLLPPRLSRAIPPIVQLAHALFR